jgi:hypothetical protein
VFSLKSLFCNVMKKSKEAVKYPPIVPRKSVMNHKNDLQTTANSRK